MPLLQDADVALRQQISDDLNDITLPEMAFLATLKNRDAYFKTDGKRFKVGADLSGSDLQIDFRTGLPSVTGVNAMNPVFAALQVPLQRGFNIEAGTMAPSAYQVGETTPKYLINRYAKSVESFSDYLALVSKGVLGAYMLKLSKDIFPPTNLTPTIAAGYATGYASIDKVMALAYPLQSGFANNAATGSGTYSYLGIDMNSSPYTTMKASQRGTVSSAFGTPSVQNVRNLIQDVVTKGGAPDLIVTGPRVNSYMLTLPEARVILEQEEKLTYGGRMLNIAGIDFLVEARMDKLALSSETGYSDEDESVSTTEYHELYCLDTSTWVFRSSSMEDIDIIDPLPGYPALINIQGYYECALACENPRYNGRAFNITGV